MRGLLLLASLVAFPAYAQDAGSTLFATADVEAKRFPDADTVGPSLSSGDRVTVVYVEGDLVRVTTGREFGWVAASALTATDPSPTPLTLGGPGGPPREFSMEALQELLDRTKAP